MIKAFAVVALSSLAIPASFLAGGKLIGKGGKDTHLGVKPHQIVNLKTFGVPKDNSSGHPFFYDRNSGAPFEVPEGFTFVVTDLMIEPISTNPTFHYVVVIEFGNDAGKFRSFTSIFNGADVRQYTFATGFTVPAGMVLDARNASSDADAQVQILGYYVQGSAAPVGLSPFKQAGG